jgi:hypothetical protein
MLLINHQTKYGSWVQKTFQSYPKWWYSNTMCHATWGFNDIEMFKDEYFFLGFPMQRIDIIYLSFSLIHRPSFVSVKKVGT